MWGNILTDREEFKNISEKPVDFEVQQSQYSKSETRNYAVILAAGVGRRFGQIIPKQYTKIGRQTILEMAVSKFLGIVNKVIVVVSKNDEYIDSFAFPSEVIVTKIGGETRFDSSKNAINFIKDNFPSCKKVLIHDACRPFVSRKLIGKVLDSLEYNEGVLPVSDITDSIKQVKANEIIGNINREEYKLAQTPQGFEFTKIWDAYNKAIENKSFTDDVGVFCHAGYKVKAIEGEVKNIKITNKEDLKNMTDIRVGFGVDVHSFTEGGGIMLGGVKVPCNYGVEAHSDGDVLLHALCDAILGACALGDIGVFFPHSDPKWKGAASEVFVKECISKMKEMGGEIVNIDLTLIAEIPKIKDLRDAIVESIANICEISKDKVNLKATTTEKLGFLGREEGIAANCVAMVSFIGGDNV